MFVTHDEATLAETMRRRRGGLPEHPVLLDRFLEDAFEVDVDAHRGRRAASSSAAIMQHIEEAGSTRGLGLRHPALPPDGAGADAIAAATTRSGSRRRLAGARPHERAVRDQGRGGLRARRSTRGPRRTVPFVAKATGVPLAKIAAQGHGRAQRSRELGLAGEPEVCGPLREGVGLPVRQVPGRGSDPGARDALDAAR